MRPDHGWFPHPSTGDPRTLLCMMSEGPRSEETAKLLKRANEENDDSAEMATKKLKAEGDIVEDEKKCPKKKVALLVAYSGKGYYGMQVAILAASPVQALKKIISCYKCVCGFFFFCASEKYGNVSV